MTTREIPVGMNFFRLQSRNTAPAGSYCSAPSTSSAASLHDDGASTSDAETEAELDIDALVQALNHRYVVLKEQWPVQTEHQKSFTKAVELREAANHHFKKARDSEALELYTRSIAVAPDKSEALALAHGNRSAVLFRICKYVPCLLDVNRALQADYPKSAVKKLQERRKQCMAEIKLASEEDKRLKRVKADATEPLRSMASSRDEDWSNLCKFGNTLIPGASAKIKIETDDNWGRHLIATTDIEPGEILSWQKFFVLTVQTDKQYTNCSYCLMKCISLISCTSCTQMYCSKYCSQLAYHSYHRVECKMSMLTKHKQSKFNDTHSTAVRMMLIGTEQGTQLRNLMKRFTLRDVFMERDNPANKVFTGDYCSVLRLSRTFDPAFLQSNLVPVVEAIILLQRAGFFRGRFQIFENEEARDTLNGTELFVAMLLMNHIGTVTRNRFSVSRVTSSDLIHEEPNAAAVVGAGVCPLHNFLNHSCDPQVGFFTRNRKHVLIALRPIKKNEQVFYSYVNSFASSPVSERTRALSSYGFTCYCRACVNHWPVEPVLLERRVDFLSQKSVQQFTCYCRACVNHWPVEPVLLERQVDSLSQNREKAIETLTRAMFLVLKEDTLWLRNREIYRTLCKVRKWIHSNIKEPSVSALHCENRLLFFMMVLFDDFSQEFMGTESVECIKLTLAAIRNHTISKSSPG